MSAVDAELERLLEQHPGWQVWRVDRYLGGTAWCARPWGRTKPVLNAGSPKHLSEAIEELQEGWLDSAGPDPLQ